MHENSTLEESDIEQTRVEVDELEEIHLDSERVFVLRLCAVQLPSGQNDCDLLVYFIHHENENKLYESSTGGYEQATEYAQELSQSSHVGAVSSRGGSCDEWTNSCSVEDDTNHDPNHHGHQAGECREGSGEFGLNFIIFLEEFNCLNAQISE